MDREHIRLVDQLSKEPEDGNSAILAGVGFRNTAISGACFS
jgi:hypothetical protein